MDQGSIYRWAPGIDHAHDHSETEQLYCGFPFLNQAKDKFGPQQ
jgi:hypothetical protein